MKRKAERKCEKEYLDYLKRNFDCLVVANEDIEQGNSYLMGYYDK